MATKRTTVKKAPARKEAVASTTESVLASSNEMPMASSTSKLSRKQISLILGVLVILALLYLLRGWFVVATVNGQPISRLSLIQELERQGGKQTLNTLVTKTLIEQEASKKQVAVTSQELDAELKRIQDSVEKQGQNFDQLLAAQGMTKAGLRDQVKLQKLLEKLVGKDVTVSEKEVDDYLTQNKAAFPEGTDTSKMRPTIKEQLKQKKLNEKVQGYLEELRKNAKINYFINL